MNKTKKEHTKNSSRKNETQTIIYYVMTGKVSIRINTSTAYTQRIFKKRPEYNWKTRNSIHVRCSVVPCAIIDQTKNEYIYIYLYLFPLNKFFGLIAINKSRTVLVQAADHIPNR